MEVRAQCVFDGKTPPRNPQEQETKQAEEVTQSSNTVRIWERDQGKPSSEQQDDKVDQWLQLFSMTHHRIGRDTTTVNLRKHAREQVVDETIEEQGDAGEDGSNGRQTWSQRVTPPSHFGPQKGTA